MREDTDKYLSVCNYFSFLFHIMLIVSSLFLHYLEAVWQKFSTCYADSGTTYHDSSSRVEDTH